MSMGPIHMTLTITKGRNMELTMRPTWKMTVVILTTVLTGRTGATSPPGGSVNKDAIQ